MKHLGRQSTGPHRKARSSRAQPWRRGVSREHRKHKNLSDCDTSFILPPPPPPHPPPSLRTPPQRLLKIARTSYAKLAGPPRTRHLCAQSCGDVSGETGRISSRAASPSPELRGCLKRNGRGLLRSGHLGTQRFRRCFRRNWPDHLSRRIWEPRLARMSQAKWAGPSQIWSSRNTDL